MPGSLRAAVALLTRVPVGGRAIAAAQHRFAPAWFPLVGLGVAVPGALVLAAARPRGGGLLAAALALALTLLLTGALHEDGLADSADALGGATDRERLFAILKDSRIGTYGAAALLMSILLRVAALDRLGEGAPIAFVLAHVTSRLSPAWLLAALPYVTPSETARSSGVSGGGRAPALIATLLAATIVEAAVARALVAPEAGAAAFAAAVATCVPCAALFRARAGGVTGDFLGAAQQVAEVGALVTLAVWPAT
jgi:adenosylcobinamide-GDP ribazoletransferase